MPVDPYQDCPCGSGKKLKWCCQKVVKYAEKAEQLLEKDQIAAATQAIDEGLAVEPENLWLRTMKAQILLSMHDHDAAYPLVDSILASNPGYRPVLQLRLQDELAHGAVEPAVATLQDILDATPAAEREEPFAWMVFVGRGLGELGYSFAALGHLRLAGTHESLHAEATRDVATIEGNPEAAPWLRDVYPLRPAPSGGGAGQRWSNAIELATIGRWRRAAAIFESIAKELPDNAAVRFNLGLCQGWTAQNEAAAASLEQYARLEMDAEQALHALALAQCLDPRESAQSVDVVRIRYPIRDTSRLIQKLKDHPRLQIHVLDAQQGELEEGVKDEFYLLNKDFVKDADAATIENLPAIVGVVRTRGTNLELEFAEPTADDARPALLLEAAGDTIDTNGERTVAGTLPLSTVRLRRMWGVPSNAGPEPLHRIRRMVHEQNYREVWPNTPLGWLGNKTPREAATVPELKSALRAALLLNEYATEAAQFDIDLSDLRRELGLEPEPTLEGDALDIDRLPLARLRQVRAEILSTPQLITLFERAMRFTLSAAVQNAAAVLVARSAERDQFNAIPAFRSLIEFARMRADRTAAQDWIAKARRFDSDAGVSPERPTWDIVEWQLSFQFDRPEQWAPRLSELMQKFGKDKEASSEMMLTLVRLGLARLVPHPQDPNRVMLDARLLEQILARYASRAGSPLDLSPVGGQPGKIWTPGSEAAGGGSPIVLPGQEPAAAPRSKLVIPGT
jgi:tetratricopeptide (TPR) repeat protein